MLGNASCPVLEEAGLLFEEPEEAGEQAASLQGSLAVTAASIALAWLMGYQIPRSPVLAFLLPFQPCNHCYTTPSPFLRILALMKDEPLPHAKSSIKLAVGALAAASPCLPKVLAL